MNDGSSTTSLPLLAQWSHDPGCSSKTCLGCSLQETASLFDELFTDWPKSGTWDSTGLWQRPTLAAPIGESVGSALPVLPTPTRSDGAGGPGGTRQGAPNIRTKVDLLATPTTSVAKDGTPQDSKGKRDLRLDARLLPTPTTRDFKGRNQRNDDTCLPGATLLLPTPTASIPNDGEALESWEARRQRNLAKGINGNGQGTPLSIAVRLYPTPTRTDAKNVGYRTEKRGAGKPCVTLSGATGSAPTGPLSVDGSNPLAENAQPQLPLLSTPDD